jgi:hypothetical protein
MSWLQISLFIFSRYVVALQSADDDASSSSADEVGGTLSSSADEVVDAA